MSTQAESRLYTRRSDQQTVEFTFHAGVYAEPPITFAGILFSSFYMTAGGGKLAENNTVVSEMDIPSDDPLAAKVRQLADIEEPDEENLMKPHDDPRIEQMRRILCERIAACRGVTETGECWALGPTALRQVIGEITAP